MILRKKIPRPSIKFELSESIKSKLNTKWLTVIIVDCIPVNILINKVVDSTSACQKLRFIAYMIFFLMCPI